MQCEKCQTEKPSCETCGEEGRKEHIFPFWLDIYLSKEKRFTVNFYLCQSCCDTYLKACEGYLSIEMTDRPEYIPAKIRFAECGGY